MSASETLLVRPAGAGDSAAICAIYNAAIAERSSTFETEPRSAAEFAERATAERFPLLVAEGPGRVVGWAGLSGYSPRSCYEGIGECSIYVAAETRSRGVGPALAGALAAEAERRGFYKLLGKLFTDNLASIRLVERCGFATVGTHRRHGKLDGEWREVLLVERLLGPALAAGTAQTSSSSVTGPSLTRATPMQAPKTPLAAPSRSQKRS